MRKRVKPEHSIQYYHQVRLDSGQIYGSRPRSGICWLFYEFYRHELVLAEISVWDHDEVAKRTRLSEAATMRLEK